MVNFVCSEQKIVVQLWCHHSLAAPIITRVGGYPVVEERRVAPHQGDGQLLKEACDLQRLLLSSVSSVSCKQGKLCQQWGILEVWCFEKFQMAPHKSHIYSSILQPGLIKLTSSLYKTKVCSVWCPVDIVHSSVGKFREGWFLPVFQWVRKKWFWWWRIPLGDCTAIFFSGPGITMILSLFILRSFIFSKTQSTI